MRTGPNGASRELVSAIEGALDNPSPPPDPTSPDPQTTGARLLSALRALIAALPGGPHKHSTLAELLSISRVTVSLVHSAVQRGSVLEFLEAVPGPESLRGFAQRARRLGTDERAVSDAEQAIDQFSALIRDRYGTRAALTAAIGSGSTGLRARVDQSARAEVFRGMRRILGVEARAWLTSMFFAPHPTESEWVSVTTLHGALGMRRLRTDTNVYFTFGAPHKTQDQDPVLRAPEVRLDDLFENEPAEIESAMVGGQLRHRLRNNELGKSALVDMLVVSENPRASRRFATPDAPLRGVSIFADVPAQILLCDAVVHKDIFPDASPQPIVYNPGARGPANPNDHARDADRINTSEHAELVPPGGERFNVAEVPHYAKMVERVCARLSCQFNDYRVYRLRIVYPVLGFQYILAFEAPHEGA